MSMQVIDNQYIGWEKMLVISFMTKRRYYM